ncbi:hypothetical protein ACGFNU_24465 [Spirillospora sp. NPDC048911]|uniref:hypothetical protein n=1 Tax=Spirillospora sp. NPDC048911 TaxID=3364527 RepID=UPI0037199A41
MFEVWDVTASRALASKATFEDAQDELDRACRQRYLQTVADGTSPAQRYDFEIRQEGQPVAWLTYTPDVGRPYESVTAAGLGTGGPQ